jgi:hypothetical protein
MTNEEAVQRIEAMERRVDDLVASFERIIDRLEAGERPMSVTPAQ